MTVPPVAGDLWIATCMHTSAAGMCEQCLSIARVYLSMFLVILHTSEVNKGSCDLVNTFDLVTSAATHPPGRLPGDLLLTKPWPFCFYGTSLLDWLGSVFEQLITNSTLVLWLPYDCHVTAHVAAAYYAFLFSSQSAVYSGSEYTATQARVGLLVQIMSWLAANILKFTRSVPCG